MPTGDFIAIACVMTLIGVVVLALVMERRERKRQERLDAQALGGRQCRRRKSQPPLTWWRR